MLELVAGPSAAGAAEARLPESHAPSTDALQAFLTVIGKVDLLTAAQEVQLAKRIERGDQRAIQEMVEATSAWSCRSRSTTASRGCRFSI